MIIHCIHGSCGGEISMYITSLMVHPILWGMETTFLQLTRPLICTYVVLYFRNRTITGIHTLLTNRTISRYIPLCHYKALTQDLYTAKVLCILNYPYDNLSVLLIYPKTFALVLLTPLTLFLKTLPSDIFLDVQNRFFKNHFCTLIFILILTLYYTLYLIYSYMLACMT